MVKTTSQVLVQCKYDSYAMTSKLRNILFRELILHVRNSNLKFTLLFVLNLGTRFFKKQK